MAKTKNPAVAEDLLVETFRAGFARIGSFETSGRSIWFWLHEIAKNKRIDANRAYDASQEAFAGFESLLDASDVPDLDHMLDWPKLQARVRAVLAKMNERYRRAIELRFFEELSSQSAGEALGVNAGTFDVTLSRALDQFRKIWEGGTP